MSLSDLVGLLRTDLADPSAERFKDETLTRCILKSVFPVGRDLDTHMSISGGEIIPEPDGETLEMLLLQARIEACRFMRAATANAFSFSSGDKRVDKTSQPEHWEKLEADLTTSYHERLREIKPDAALDDGYIITPKPLRPVIFEQGRHHHRHGHIH
ncbi:MAG: hypothetical protein GX139_01685 [Armatimonadetes bacterium]|jgi:hypothetical protein|nr:hypothetical protein [Armatimonadota bacterium]